MLSPFLRVGRDKENKEFRLSYSKQLKRCVCSSYHGICYQRDGREGEPKWQSMEENQDGRITWDWQTRDEYQLKRVHTHTQKSDTPVPTTGYPSYKALTPPPLGTQGK